MGDDTPLITIETQALGQTTEPPDQWRIVHSTSGQAPATVVTTIATQPTAIAPLAAVSSGIENDDLGRRFLIGSRNGRLWNYQEDDGIVSPDSGSPDPDSLMPVGWGAICAYNDASYYGRGNRLWRRYYDNTGYPVHTEIKEMASHYELRSFVVWQNRMWFLGLASGGRTSLLTSDGVTVVSVLDFPQGFQGWVLHQHYGSLYIGGEIGSGEGFEALKGQVWRYNGASLTKLWEQEGADTALSYGVRSMCSWDRFVCWGKHGLASVDSRAGLWLYDAEEDALLEGPGLEMDPAASNYVVTAVCQWNGSVAVAFQDRRTITPSTYDHPCTVGWVRKGKYRYLGDGAWLDQSFGYRPATITQKLTSSEYDANLPGVDKVVSTGLLRCKVPADTRIRVELIADGGTPVEVKTIDHDAAAPEWRIVRFNTLDAGEQIRGVTFKYTVYLENLSDLAPEAAPEVAFVGFQFRPAPDRRRQWHVRVLATDDQERLNGDSNPLATRDALTDKLTNLWLTNEALRFWAPSADGATSGTGDGIKVTIGNFTEQSYRLSSDTPEVASEVSFTLLEELESA